jgi:DNA-binding CsgD family transcriptional regulator
VTEESHAQHLARRTWALEATLLQIRTELQSLRDDDAPNRADRDESRSSPLPVDLPARQRDVAAMILQGRSIEQIATELDLSPHTVRNHLRMVFRRTGVHSRAAFVARYHL